ncbi:MAG: putative bifunctional diguanylate cyclase/phosphodiesterase [Octadecabacter sp.]
MADHLTDPIFVRLGLIDAFEEPLSNDMARRLRCAQIKGAIEQMRLFVFANTIFAPVLAMQAWNSGINGTVVCWTACMLLFSWWLIWRWRTSYHTTGALADMDRFVSETQLNSTIWCAGLIMFYPHVAGDQKTILTTVMAGSLALGTVGFSQAPRAAAWYLAIQGTTLTMVPLVYGILRNSSGDFLLAALAFFATFAVGNTVLERARAQLRAFRNTESLTQKTEIVELLLKDFAEQSVEWIWKTDASGKLLVCPDQIMKLMDIKLGAEPRVKLLDELERSSEDSGADQLMKVWSAFQNQVDFHDVTLPIKNAAEDATVWIMMRGRPQFENEVFIGYRGIFADATATIQAQKRVEYLAERDPLTGLYNRTEIQSKLSCLNPETQSGTVYFVDLDKFKQVNDRYGHAAGDELLQQVAERLLKVMGAQGFASRLGGDEFLMYADTGSGLNYTETSDLCDHLLSALSSPFIIGEYDIVMSASIGTANFPIDTRNGEVLLRLADMALYEAKIAGRNQHVAFRERMQHALQKRVKTTERLRYAMRDDLIVPQFQPQYCTRSGKIVGFEALARWNDPELGVVGPDIFIPIAEETGLIHKIGKDILRAACAAAQDWSSISSTFNPTIAVNVSPIQVTRGDFVSVVSDALARTGLPPHQLEIEVTEGILIDDIDGTGTVLKELSDLGVKIALDDFGTGYSSLSYLRALPLDRLKIDRSFILNIADEEGRSVVRAIIDLCRSLDLEVIAEGVEQQSHVDILRSMDCDFLQGYKLSPPLRYDEVSPILDKEFACVA